MQTKLVRVDDLHRFFSSFFKKNRFFFSVAPFLAIASPSSTFFYRFFLGVSVFTSSLIEFYRVLPSFTEFIWVLPSFTAFYRVCSNRNGFHVDLTEFYLILPNLTGFYLVILSFTGFY